MKMKKWMALATAGAMLTSLSACSGGKSGELPGVTYNDAGVVIKTETKLAEKITATLHTTLGNITLELYPGKAPLAVENFITHAKDGYYNGVKFHRVVKDFMIQTGDPLGTGLGGNSIWDTNSDDAQEVTFKSQFDPSLRHYRGALSMAKTSAPDSNGSQFFIVQAGPDQVSQNSLDQLIKQGKQISEEVQKKYLEVGGTPHLDDAHTVFGMVTEGMDVVDAIANVEVDGTTPVEDVKILSIDIVEG